jgi:hypothetical protein
VTADNSRGGLAAIAFVNVRLAIDNASDISSAVEKLHELLALASELRPAGARGGILFQPA